MHTEGVGSLEEMEKTLAEGRNSAAVVPPPTRRRQATSHAKLSWPRLTSFEHRPTQGGGSLVGVLAGTRHPPLQRPR